jgi:hypothetical protein
MPHLAKGKAGDVGDLLQSETCKVVHVYNPRGIGNGLFQPFHQHADLDNTLRIGSFGLFD